MPARALWNSSSWRHCGFEPVLGPECWLGHLQPLEATHCISRRPYPSVNKSRSPLRRCAQASHAAAGRADRCLPRQQGCAGRGGRRQCWQGEPRMAPEWTPRRACCCIWLCALRRVCLLPSAATSGILCELGASAGRWGGRSARAYLVCLSLAAGASPQHKEFPEGQEHHDQRRDRLPSQGKSGCKLLSLSFGAFLGQLYQDLSLHPRCPCPCPCTVPGC
jgi:hypothetical protein